nr:hypothetical protein [Chloroflexaceae bacterium]
MDRRTFLTLSGGFAAALFGASAHPAARAADARLERWRPSTVPTQLMEWRYLAGRINDGTDDVGFVVSISDIRVPTLQGQEMLVMRQELNGQRRFATRTYAGTLNYNAATATYSFSSN